MQSVFDLINNIDHYTKSIQYKLEWMDCCLIVDL